MNVLLELFSRGFFLTIDETLEGLAAEGNVDKNLATKRLNTWRDAATAGDNLQFIKLLNSRGLNYDNVLAKLGEQHQLRHPPPSWLKVLIEVINSSVPELRSLSPEAIRNNARPFGYITQALAKSAESYRDRLLDQAALERFLPQARLDLREYLCDRVQTVLEVPLYKSFKSWIGSLDTETKMRVSGYSAADANDSSHRAFLDDFVVHGMDKLWYESPALVRVLGNVLEQWINSTRELVERFDANQSELRSFIAACPQNLLVEKVRSGLSDLHNGGRSVCVLSLQESPSLVYKPRSVSAEFAWQGFLEWVNERLPSVKLRAMQVLKYHDYGWCEFIDGSVEINESRVQTFFHRAGVLLGLLHLLAATDMHEENLVACGEHPILVDLEMLFQPEIAKQTPAGAEVLRANSLARDLIANSMLETGFLPMIVKTPETATVGQGGLSHHPLFGPRKVGWIHINRFQMTPQLEAGERLQLFNLPKVDGNSARLLDHWDTLKQGVELALRFAIAHKSDLLKEGGPLERFKGIPIRIIVRPTRYYEMLIRRLLDFRMMSDTQSWSCQADFSARFELSPDQPIWPQEFIRRERADLVALNVPHFEVATDEEIEIDSKALGTQSQRYTSGYDRVMERIVQLDERKISQQINILDLSLLAFKNERYEQADQLIESIPKQTTVTTRASRASVDESLFRDEIKRIVALLKHSAIRESGGCTWLGLTPVGDTNAVTLSPLGHALYDGTSGVALFLAAASVAVEDVESRILCLEALAATRWYLKNESAAGFTRTLGMGGVGGIGSVIYALTSIARILSAPELLDDALHASRLITRAIISGDRTFDITKGSAGTILALVHLYADTMDNQVLECANECAEHLLTHRPDKGDTLWKRNREPAALAGMSHGASGYALAFHRLYRITRDTRYLRVVKDCLSYERSVFSKEHQNWPDLRPSEHNAPTEFPVRWCHGSIGVAFTRLDLMEGGYEDASLQLEYEIALKTSSYLGSHMNDSLCCGNLGAIALLMEPCVGKVNGELNRRADRLLTSLIRHAQERGSYQWQGGRDNHNPGLFRGVSGVGYILAKKLLADDLPNVLTLS